MAAFQPPSLADRSFDDLVEDMLRRIPAHTPEWRNPRLGDPGRTLVELFAWLHDSRRQDDGGDPGHGHRAAEFALELQREGTLEVTDARMELLVEACRYHSHGRTDADISVQVCWDADRLDLGRVGTRPDPSYLCTDPARDRRTIRWEYARSLGRRADVPD